MEDQLVYKDKTLDGVKVERELLTLEPLNDKGCKTGNETASMSKKKRKKVNRLRSAIREAKREEEEEKEIEDPTMKQKHKDAIDASNEPYDEGDGRKKLNEINDKIEAVATRSVTYTDDCIKNLERKIEADHSILKNEMTNERDKLKLQQDELCVKLKELENDNVILREQVKRNEDITSILRNINELRQGVEELKTGMNDCKNSTGDSTNQNSTKRIKEQVATKSQGKTKSFRTVDCKYWKNGKGNCKYGNKCCFRHPGILGSGEEAMK